MLFFKFLTYSMHTYVYSRANGRYSPLFCAIISAKKKREVGWGLRKRVGGGGTLRIFAILSKLRASLILDIQTQGSRTGKVEVGGWVGGRGD